MAVASKALPYGLRDVKLTPLGSDGATPGTPVDLPVSQTLSFSETEDFEELRGDDTVAASHGNGPTVEWDLESGGISLEAYAVMAGGTVTTTGVSPNEEKRYTKLSTEARPYFKIEGRAINDNGGDFHGIIYRAKADGSLEGEMADGSFWISSASGKGYGSLESAFLDRVYDFVHNETAVEIPTAPPSSEANEVQDIIITATGGTFTVDYDSEGPSAALAYDISAPALRSALEAMSAPGDFEVVLVAAGHYRITFVGDLAASDQPTLELDVSSLTGGSAIVVTVVEGSA